MVEKVETRTRSVVEVETVDVEELRCTGPCEDFYPEEELREVKVDTGRGEIITAPVCVYCCENLWKVDADRKGGIDVDEVLRVAASGVDALRGGMIRFSPVAIGVGFAIWLGATLLNMLGAASTTIQEAPTETVDPLFVVSDLLPVVVLMAIIISCVMLLNGMTLLGRP